MYHIPVKRLLLSFSMLLAFSLHFSSSSAFLRSLFRQFSHLRWGLYRFCDLFVSQSQIFLAFFHSDHVSIPSHLTHYFSFSQQASVTTSSFRSFILVICYSSFSLHRLFSQSNYSHILIASIVVCQSCRLQTTCTCWHYTGIQLSLSTFWNSFYSSLLTLLFSTH